MSILWRAIRHLKLSSGVPSNIILVEATNIDKNKALISCLVEVNMLSRQIEDKDEFTHHGDTVINLLGQLRINLVSHNCPIDIPGINKK